MSSHQLNSRSPMPQYWQSNLQHSQSLPQKKCRGLLSFQVLLQFLTEVLQNARYIGRILTKARDWYSGSVNNIIYWYCGQKWRFHKVCSQTTTILWSCGIHNKDYVVVLYVFDLKVGVDNLVPTVFADKIRHHYIDESQKLVVGEI